MKLGKFAVLAASTLALAAGSAWAADNAVDKNNDGKVSKKEASNATRSDESGFAKLDKNKDGYISKAEAKGETELSKNFDKWDLNNDGKINRAEYLAAMAKEDTSKAVNKVESKFSKDKNASGSATGGSSTSRSSGSTGSSTSTTK
jgi:Ca2+-binding EF-hand superfamily protein